MTQSTISDQAEKYAEVIVGQIADNFTALHLAMDNCDDLVKAQKKYDALDADDTDELSLKTAKDKMEIIQNTIGTSFCSDNTRGIEPLAVGLFGEWGSGKTHQLKLIQERIKRIQNKDYKPQGNKSTFPTDTVSIPIFFNAWRFEKEEHIILPLFQTLLQAVESHDRTLAEQGKRKLKSLGHQLKNIVTSLHHGLKVPNNIVYTGTKIMAGDMSAIVDFTDSKKVVKKGEEKTNKDQVGK